MRIIAIIFGILTILLGGAYFLAFTQSGNNIIKPYIEDFISKKIEKEVKIEKLTLNLDHLSLQANVSNEASLLVDGDIKLLNQWFDLIYQIEAENLKTPTIIIRDKLQVQGNLKGVVDDFVAKGNGKAFGSNLDFNLHLVDKYPQDGTINAKGINTAKVLELVGKPAYTTGLVDIDAQIQNEKGDLVGGADILIHESSLDEKLISRDFNVTIPKGISYVGKVHGKVNGDVLKATSQVVSSLATFKTTDTNINLKTSQIDSDFSLSIKDLKKLEFLTKKRLFGSLAILGDVKKTDDNLIVNVNSDIYDGKFSAKLQNNRLTANGKSFQIKKILEMLGEPAIAYGVVDFDANIDDISKKDKSGGANIVTKNGELVGSIMRSKFGYNFPPVTNFSSILNAKLSKDVLDVSTDLKSTLANIKTKKSSMNINSQNFSSDFEIDVDNLTPIGKILKQDLRGKFSLNGDVALKDKMLSFNAFTSSLGGKIEAKMKDDKLDALLKDVAVEKILYLLNKPTFAKGSMNANAKFSNISTKSINGTFNYTLNNGLLLGEGLKKLTQNDINYPKSSPFAIKSDMDVKNGFATFTNSINSDLASVPSFKGTYDINKKVLNSDYHVDIKDLSKLSFLTKRVLKGALQAKGIVAMKDDNLKATVHAPILGGNSDTLFDKNILTSKASKISVKGLCELMDFPYVFDSFGDFNLNYNTTSKKGDYSLFMKEGHMVANQLTNLVKTFTKYDMTSEVYKDTILKGKINDTKVTYILDLIGSQTAINIPNGIYDLVTQKTSANFKLKFQKTDLAGTISGTSSSPKVSIDSSNYLKNKVKDKAAKELDKYVPEKQKGIVKDLLKLF